MFKQVCSVLALMLVTSATTTGCGGGDDEGASSGKTIRIAWIPKESGNEVFAIGLEGARLKARELSELTGNHVEIVYLAPDSAADIEGQKNSVQQAIDMQVDAIAISCSSPEVSEKVDQAVAAGIPTMSWDSDCRRPNGEASNRFTYFGIDNRATGRLAARLARAVLEQDANLAPPYKIGILSGVPVATNLQARVAGVWDELKQMDTCRYNESDAGPWLLDKCWPETLDPAEAMFHVYGDDPEKCQNSLDSEACASTYTEVETAASGEVLEALIERDRDGDDEPDLSAVILTGLWPLFAYSADDADNEIPAWTEATRAGRLHTISYDALAFQVDMASDGLVDALIGQKYWGWGYGVVQIVYDELEGNASADPTFTDSGADVVCPNNFAVVSAMWSLSDFTRTLPACEYLD